MTWYEQQVIMAREQLVAKGAEQVPYAGILESLGYSENRTPFLALSETLPVAFLRASVRLYPPPERSPAVRSLLMTAAGWQAQGQL